MFSNSSRLIVAVFGAATAFAAAAHDTWLARQPAQPASAPGRPLSFDLTSGQQFPELDFAVQADRIQRRGCTSDHGACRLVAGHAGAHSLTLQSDVSPATAAMVWIQLAPRTLELSPDKIAEYLDEIDASAEFRQAWNDRSRPKRWRESYVKCAKSIVVPGMTGSALWSSSAGMELELLPMKDPTMLDAGEPWAVRVLRHGKPVPDLAVGIVGGPSTAGVPRPRFQRSDANGIVRFAAPGAGRWMLRATDLRRADEPGLDWRSTFTTLSFEIAATPLPVP